VPCTAGILINPRSPSRPEADAASIASLSRYRHGVLPDVLALSYRLVGYGLGAWLLFAGHWWLNLARVLVTGHSLVYSAYLVHELAHRSIFRSRQPHHAFGTLMTWIKTWINASRYAPFETLRREHKRHHLDRAEIVTLDHSAFLDRPPDWFCRPGWPGAMLIAAASVVQARTELGPPSDPADPRGCS